MRASTTSTSLTVTLYGRDDGRAVAAAAGPRRPVAGEDFRITVTRKVTRPGQTVRQQQFTTTYNLKPAGE